MAPTAPGLVLIVRVARDRLTRHTLVSCCRSKLRNRHRRKGDQQRNRVRLAFECTRPDVASNPHSLQAEQEVLETSSPSNAGSHKLFVIKCLRMHDRFRLKLGNTSDCLLVSPRNNPCIFLRKLEAPPGFEPGMEVLQTSALPLGDGAV